MIPASLNTMMMGGGIPQDFTSFWSMDNISGTTLVDESGSFDGTISGATAVAGHVGDALDFDGTSDNVSMGTSALSTLTGDFAICLWTDLDAADCTLFAKYDATPIFFELIATATNYMARCNNVNVVDPTSLGTYTYPFLVMQFNTDTLELWVDGLMVASAACTRNTSGSAHGVYIGQRGFSGAENYTNGRIDQVRVYPRALSQAEITALYQEAI